MEVASDNAQPLSLPVKKLNPNAKLPTRGSEHAAGYDLYAVENKGIYPGLRSLVPTGIAVAIPAGFYGRVAPRSGVSLKGVDVGAGVIDADYRGEVKVLLINHNKDEFDYDERKQYGIYEIKAGDRIAQLILERITTPPVQEVETLPDTQRGTGGFGSTGV